MSEWALTLLFGSGALLIIIIAVQATEDVIRSVVKHSWPTTPDNYASTDGNDPVCVCKLCGAVVRIQDAGFHTWWHHDNFDDDDDDDGNSKEDGSPKTDPGGRTIKIGGVDTPAFQ